MAVCIAIPAFLSGLGSGIAAFMTPVWGGSENVVVVLRIVNCISIGPNMQSVTQIQEKWGAFE
jgi:hypothetical protein